jgi:site-specific DNA-methyltransferase (cytosine-N4-specific)
MSQQSSALEMCSVNEPQGDVHDWTFNGAPTREHSHSYHDYPARMIPQVAGKLLDTLATNATLLFDPYCGSGTSLVEGMIRGIDVIGTDINPLARLIAQAKTSVPDLKEIDNQLYKFTVFISKSRRTRAPAITTIPGITRLDFWFKPHVIVDLTKIKSFMDGLEDASIRRFFQVAFSETVRESSNTRNEEFKLYRYESERLEKFNPDVFGIMLSKLKRNRAGLEAFTIALNNTKHVPRATIHDFNTVFEIPAEKVSPNCVDIVVTSPPYGDSHTTVAYGQYSRLSAAWLGLNEPDKIDQKLMGGKAKKEQISFPSKALNEALHSIKQIDEKRYLEVSAFYADLQNSIKNVATVVRHGGYACYVVGNRKVKGVILPTDAAVRNFFEHSGFEYLDTFHRSIPNKRMPLQNSPTNTSGAVESTMTREYIVVMRRPES